MRRLVCTFVVRKHENMFSRVGAQLKALIPYIQACTDNHKLIHMWTGMQLCYAQAYQLRIGQLLHR